ncbi:MAG: hypothetical protein ACM31D_15130 [Bacteroidota bacterium]
MFRLISVAAVAALALTSASAMANSAPPSSAGYSCQQLPEIKAALDRVIAKQADRDRIGWQVNQAERLCSEGKAQEAKGYLDLAHSMVFKDHTH